MGATSSRIDNDKALLLCRERRRYVRQALDGRCSLAAAHISYIQALRNIGMALGKLVEPEAPVVSSLYTSTPTSETPKPFTMTDKSASQFSNSSPSMSQHVETVESSSLTPSPPGSRRFHVNCMKLESNYSTTVEEKPPILVKATLQSSSNSSPKALSHTYENSNLDATPPRPATPPWDYFDLFHPIDNHFSMQDGSAANHVSDGADDIKQLSEEEGILDMENEVERSSVNGKSEYLESEDEFDQSSCEPLVRIFKNRNELLDTHSATGSADVPFSMDTNLETKQTMERTTMKGPPEHDETPSLTPKSTPATPLQISEKSECKKEFVGVNRNGAKEFLSSIKEVEILFLKASESGKEVPRMLEANKVSFRTLFPEGQAQKSKGHSFFNTLFACGRDSGDYEVDEPASNEIKYLTWHRSVSSLSSSSHNPLVTTSGDGVGGTSSSLFSSVCMNSGSHASTLDRLYAWERKLYDEVKASGIIRKDYDMKCMLLRQLDSKAKVLDLKEDSSNKIARTRAKVKDLHSRIKVAIQRIDSISKTIEELRDKELQPQLEELIGGLLQMWETMLECHRRQLSIISVSTNNGGLKIPTLSESNRQAAGLLVYELNCLHSSFMKWISAQKSYLQSINHWLLKCVIPVKQKSSRRRKVEFSPRRDVAPPVYITCKEWLEGLNQLPTKEVADAIKELVAETTHLMPREEKNRRIANLSFSLSQKIQSGESREHLLQRETPVNWSVGLDGLKQNLEVFIDRLKALSEMSVTMYVELGCSIVNARNKYETGGKRM